MMPLAFLPAHECFISLLRCPEKKSGLLPAGATGDPQPVAEGGTSWASPAQFPRGALNLAPEIGAVSPDVFTFSEGGLHVGTEHGAAQPGCCKAEVLRAPLWHRLPKNWGADPGTHRGAPLCTAVLAACCWDQQSLSASLSLWCLVYDLLGRDRCRDKQEEEVVQRRMSHCICSSPPSRVNQEVLWWIWALWARQSSHVLSQDDTSRAR